MGNLFQPKLFWQWKWKLINIERPYIIFPNIGLLLCKCVYLYIYISPHSFRQNGNGLNGVAQPAGNVTDGTFPSLYTWHDAQLSNHGTRSQMFCIVFIFLNFQLGNSPGEVDLTKKEKKKNSFSSLFFFPGHRLLCRRVFYITKRKRWHSTQRWLMTKSCARQRPAAERIYRAYNSIELVEWVVRVPLQLKEPKI